MEVVRKKPPVEFSTTHGPKSHYARHADGTRMTQSFPTEVALVQHLHDKYGIDLRQYDYTTTQEIPNAVFTHHWLLRTGTPLEQYSRRLEAVDWLVFATHATPAAVTEIKEHLREALSIVEREEIRKNARKNA